MPIFFLWTNVSKVPPGFCGKMTSFLAEITGKPLDRIMCVVNTATPMAFGGTEAPTALLTLSSVGTIDPVSNKRYSAALCDYISKELDVNKERIMIKFQNLQGSDVGWNGITRE